MAEDMTLAKLWRVFSKRTERKRSGGLLGSVEANGTDTMTERGSMSLGYHAYVLSTYAFPGRWPKAIRGFRNGIHSDCYPRSIPETLSTLQPRISRALGRTCEKYKDSRTRT